MDPHDLQRLQFEWEAHSDSYTIGKTGDGPIMIVNYSLPNMKPGDHDLRSVGYEIMELLKEVEDKMPPFRAIFSPHDNPNLPTDWELRNQAIKHAAAGTFLDINDPPPVKLNGWVASCPPTSPAVINPLDLDAPAPSPIIKTFIHSHRLAMDPCLHPSHLLLHGQFLSHNKGPVPHRFMPPQFSHSSTTLHHDITPAMPINWIEDLAEDWNPKWEERRDERLQWRGTNTGIWHAQETRWREAHRARTVMWAGTRGAGGNGDVVVLGAGRENQRVGKGETVKWARWAPAMLDVAFAGVPGSCAPDLCEELKKVFEWRKPLDMIAAGDYKYVLDVDGHGWSSRFKRLITSNSLIFKATVYPEWFTDRIAPWVHYIPVQLDLSDLADSLTFFRGDPTGDGAHDDLAKKIAMAGREWSLRFWRKEDLTAYMFSHHNHLQWSRMDNDARPPTIAYLANIAVDNFWDDSKELKYWLRMAEKLRKEAQVCYDDGDLQTAFIKFARASVLVMEHLPAHRDYTTLLTPDQRRNLHLTTMRIHGECLKNGKYMMERMAEIRPILLQRVTDWDHAHQARTPKTEVRFGETQVLPSVEEHIRAVNAKLDLEDKQDAELRRTAALHAAQKAAAAGDEERMRRQRQREDEVRERMLRQQVEERARHLRQQEEMRQREEEIRRKNEQKRKEKVEIARRQQEADQAAQSIRQTISANNPGVTVAPSSYAQPTAPSPYIEPYRLPLESPATMYDGDTTDSDSSQSSRRRVGSIEYPSRPPARGGSISYPSPITTTSLPPAEARIQYPQLMTQHQQRQGYQPAFDNAFQSSSYPRPMPLPPHRMPHPQPAPIPSPTIHQPAYPGPSRPAPPPPPSQQQPQKLNEPPRLTKDGLRHVNLPRECLSRFISIAMANTSKNLETCGLLLGRDRGHKYAVTTLLIPKQHATSDTCTMDEEELVMQFTEERGLITLGWISTRMQDSSACSANHSLSSVHRNPVQSM
ncbi:hypothetical protein C0995_014655 [Termitomyces sp. Mi166|nr:hypothetical protein C0995_014655 [Termitomyces sp. Mi166\